MSINPRVVDVSHWQGRSINWQIAANAGLWGVINKCTEGSGSAGYVDDTYTLNRKAAAANNLDWGAYHFLRPGSMSDQVNAFVSHAEPDANTLMALDHEDPRVSVTSAREFMDRLDQKLGRSCVLYSGFLIKQQLGAYHDPFWGSHRWWMAQYSANPQGQASWASIWLWQYTGDGNGLLPHSIPGVGTNIDINSYGGTRDQLKADWAGGVATPAPAPVLDPNAKPMLMFGSKNVAAVKMLQQALNAAGAMIGVDGDFGTKTLAAVRTFQGVRGLSVDGVVGDKTWAALNG